MKVFIVALIAATVALSSAKSVGKANIEAVPYTVINTFENGIEEREYPAQKWSTVNEVTTANNMDKVRGDMFMTLFNYISGKNDKDAKIPMTKPVSTKVASQDADSMTYEMGFFIPAAFQNETPEPSNENVKIVERGFRVYSISFGGFATETIYNQKLNELAAFLRTRNIEVPNAEDSAEPSRYFVAYNSPFEILNRKNEVWIQA